MHRIALFLVLCFTVSSFAMAQQGSGNTKTNVEKTDKRANTGGKASQQRNGHSGTTSATSSSTSTNKPPQ